MQENRYYYPICPKCDSLYVIQATVKSYFHVKATWSSSESYANCEETDDDYIETFTYNKAIFYHLYELYELFLKMSDQIQGVQ